MTTHWMESLEWLLERRRDLKHELDIIEDLITKNTELNRIKFPDPTKKDNKK